MNASFRDNTNRHRFELLDGEHVLGFADYTYNAEKLVITHTEVDPPLKGKGIGSQLAAKILDSLRAKGQRVVPACGFIASYIERHPEYADVRASNN